MRRAKSEESRPSAQVPRGRLRRCTSVPTSVHIGSREEFDSLMARRRSLRTSTLILDDQRCSSSAAHARMHATRCACGRLGSESWSCAVLFAQAALRRASTVTELDARYQVCCHPQLTVICFTARGMKRAELLTSSPPWVILFAACYDESVKPTITVKSNSTAVYQASFAETHGSVSVYPVHRVHTGKGLRPQAKGRVHTACVHVARHAENKCQHRQSSSTNPCGIAARCHRSQIL